jgi:hypothetical protein
VIPLQDGKTFLATALDSHQIWKINSETGAMSVYAGTVEGGYRDGLSQYASFNDPQGLALMQDGCVVVADCRNHSLRLISPCGRFVGTLAGFEGGEESKGYLDGDAQSAKLNHPWEVCVGLDDSIYFTDGGNKCIRKVTDGMVTTVAGAPYHHNEEGHLHVDGHGSEVRFSQYINGISGDAIGDLYVCDLLTIRKIDSSGNVTTVVGDPEAESDRIDGDFDEARFFSLGGLVIDGEGNLIVSDGDRKSVV